MELEIDKIYTFKIVEQKVTTTGKIYTLIEDEFGNTHTFPIHLKGNKINLKVIEKKERKYLFSICNDLETKHKFDVTKFQVGKTYGFKFLEIETIPEEKATVKNSRLVLTDNDGFVKFKIPIFHWQLSPLYTPNVIFCEVTKIDAEKKLLFLKQSVNNLKHPFFEKGKEYDFSFVRYDNEDYNSDKPKSHVIVRGIDELEYKLLKPFDEFDENEKIKYYFDGINQSGSLYFRQFVPFEKIVTFRALKRLTYDIFRDIKDNPIITKIFEDYDNKQNLWILSFCNVLEEELDKSVGNEQFEQALIYVEVLIEFEKWILESGYLNTFIENRVLNEDTAKRKLSIFEYKKVALEQILDNKCEKYIHNTINLLIIDKSIDLSRIRIIIEILNYIKPSDSIKQDSIINLIILLGKYDFFKTLEKERFELLSFIQTISKEIEEFIFTPIFTNSNKRDKYFNNNSELKKLIEFTCLQILIYKDCKFSDNLTVSAVKLLRYKSLLSETKNSKINLIKIAIQLAFNNIESRKITSNFSWLKFDDIINDFEYNSINYVKPTIEKVTILTECLQNKEDIIGNVIGLDRFGYIINIFDNQVMLPKQWIHDCSFLDSEQNPERALNVNVVRIDEHFGKLLVSGKFKHENKSINNQEIVEGAIVEGVVRKLEDYGAFIDLGTCDGLLHKSEISNFLVSNVSDFLKLFEKVQLKIIRITENNGKKFIELSRKQLDNNLKPKINTTYKGRVCRITDLGIYIETTEGFTGFIHKDFISYQNISYQDYFKFGEFINIKLNIINNDNTLVFNSKIISQDPFNKPKTFINKTFKGTIYLITKEEISVKFTDYTLIGKCKEQSILNQLSTIKIQPGKLVDFKVIEIESQSQTIIVDIDLCKIQKNELSYHYENIDNVFNIEIGNCYEHFAFLIENNSEKMNYLNWAKHFYSMGTSAKSYYLGLFIDYQELIHNMKVDKKDIDELDIVIKNSIESSNKLISVINNQILSTQIFPTLKHITTTLEVLSCFGQTQKEKLSYLFSILETNNNEYDYELLEKVTKLVLSFNLLSLDMQDPKTKYLRWTQLYELLKEGLLKIETEDENDIQLRTELQKLIDGGENQMVEFKASLQKPVHTNIKREIIANYKKQLKIAEESLNEVMVISFTNKIDAIEKASTKENVIHSAMKNLAAFTNSKGGNLIIGLEDDKNILGIDFDYDKTKNVDKCYDTYLNTLDDLVTRYLGTSFNQYIKYHNFVKIDDKVLLWLIIEKSKTPVFVKLNEKGCACNDFYIRAQVSSRKLDAAELWEYYRTQFDEN